MRVRIKRVGVHPLPTYQTEHAAAVDLHARLHAPVTLGPLERQLIPSGIALELPAGYEAQIRPRSGLAIKHGISMVNTPGTIDADYRGEIGVLLINLSNEPFIVSDGDRIAQMVIAPCERVEWVEVDDLNGTERASGGFGHTGR